MGVLHRDIKPENFLLSDISATATVKLADFGLSTFFRRGELEKEAVGSPFYMAPEMVMRGSPGYGPEADIWSCGVCLYKFLSGRLPFPGETSADVFTAIRHNEVDYAHPSWRGVSSAARDLLRRILEKDPAQRISAEGILTSPWMTRHANGSSSRLAPEATVTLPPLAPNSPRAAGTGTGFGLNRSTSMPSSSTETKASSTLPRRCNSVGTAMPSARIFFLPEAARPMLHGFIDTFKTALEQPYQRLMQAPGPDSAAMHWGEVCAGLQELNDYLIEHGSDSSDGPFFEGEEHGFAEAATAPALFRMAACLEGIRGLSLLATCNAMGLTRLAAWLKEVLSRPTEVCDVAALPDHVYVTMARKLHVKYEGPPSPTAFSSPRSSLNPIDVDALGTRGVSDREVALVKSKLRHLQVKPRLGI